MRFLPFALAVLTASTLSAAASEIDLTAASMAGKEAQFTQRFIPKGFKNAQTESGTVVFGTLPAMRWTYSAPEQKIFVFDGTRSWFYVPADKQVTVGRLDDNRKKELPFLLIGDPAAREKYFVVREQSRGGSVTTTLQPRETTAMIRSISIVTGAADHLIRSVEYTDREGNRTAFELSGYHPHPASTGEFEFTPPPGVQVVNAE
jgi:outer membrane lipoprotein carrier protein